MSGTMHVVWAVISAASFALGYAIARVGWDEKNEGLVEEVMEKDRIINQLSRSVSKKERLLKELFDDLEKARKALDAYSFLFKTDKEEGFDPQL